jgi:hypothetical protein
MTLVLPAHQERLPILHGVIRRHGTIATFGRGAGSSSNGDGADLCGTGLREHREDLNAVRVFASRTMLVPVTGSVDGRIVLDMAMTATPSSGLVTAASV